MKRICSWCKKPLGIVRHSDQDDSVITHGMCENCLNTRIQEPPSTLVRFLDKLKGCVLLVDPTGTIKSANKEAQKLLKMTLPQIEGQKGGDVLACINATLPGGCGNNVKCMGCTIRETVSDTRATGKIHLKAPAYVDRAKDDAIQRINLSISTEKVQDLVLLRIDEMDAPQP